MEPYKLCRRFLSGKERCFCSISGGQEREGILMSAKKHKIFVVNNEPATHKTMEEMLSEIDCDVICFANADACFNELKQNPCSLLIAAMEIPGTDGIAILNKSKAVAPWTPVIMVTASGDITSAVRAIKLGAADYLRKPLKKDAFLSKVRAILFRGEFDGGGLPHKLTETEKRVLKLILDGQGNKKIAYKLGCVVRTVEFHRSNIYKKFEVDNVVDLTKKAMAFFTSQ
jgi:two-component system response regulator FixJ